MQYFKILLSVIVAILLFAPAAFPQSITSDAIVFACPPCGCEGDSEGSQIYGSCTHCGMSKIARFTSSLKEEHVHSHYTNERKSVAILIFDRVQIIDFTGPYEVFGQAGMRVFTVAKSDSMITTAMGMKVTPAYSFENCPKADILVIPGGGINQSLNDDKVIKWITARTEESEISLSVCNGAFFLGRAGLLDGKKATTFASLIPGLRAATPKAEIVSDQRYVDNGRIVTSAGLSSGLDGSLHVVEKLYGRGRAQEVATNLEYDWDPKGSYVRAALADQHLMGLRHFLMQFEHRTILHEGTKDHWSSTYQIGCKLSQEQIFSLMKTQLTGADKWKNTGSSSQHSSWSFSSASGENWKADIRLEEEKENVYQIRIMLNRSV